MKLYVVRHGQTIFNQLNKVQGWADTPLTKKGEEDGKMAGQRLKNVKFNAAYSSDTSRAIHTAEFVLAENNNPTPQLKFMPEWREYFSGALKVVATILCGVLSLMHSMLAKKRLMRLLSQYMI